MIAWQKKTRESVDTSTREELGSTSLIMDWQSRRNKKWIRTVALLLTVCFIHQDLVWAQGGAPVWLNAPTGNVSARPQSNPASGITIPKDVAITKEVFNAGDKTIINIQDAHSSLD
ncbi:MAG: hypothetical protein WC779_08380, partial [Candidatus Omnitrophota bacterium]